MTKKRTKVSTKKIARGAVMETFEPKDKVIIPEEKRVNTSDFKGRVSTVNTLGIRLSKKRGEI